MFQTNVQWEELANIEFFRSLLQEPGLRRYSMVELSVNCPIFNLDMYMKGELMASGVYSRFQVLDLSVAVRALLENDCARASVSIQLRDNEKKSYVVYRITEIHEGIDENAKRILLYRRDNGQLYIDGIDAVRYTGTPQALLWAELNDN